MRLDALMTTDVLGVGPRSSLKEAARRMIEAGVSGLVVTNDTGRLVGIITEADFVKAESLRRAGKRARLLRWLAPDAELPETERHVEDVMTAEVVTLGPEADHAEAARLMRTAQVKRIPVVDDEGSIVGMISRSDILRAFARPDLDIVSEIEDHVMVKILWIDPHRVRISVIEGNVVLRGELETKSDAILLEDLTRRLDGVVSVRSELTWEIDNTRLEMVPPVPGPRFTRY